MHTGIRRGETLLQRLYLEPSRRQGGMGPQVHGDSGPLAVSSAEPRTGDHEGQDFPNHVAGEKGTRRYAVSVHLYLKAKTQSALGVQKPSPLRPYTTAHFTA